MFNHASLTNLEKFIRTNLNSITAATVIDVVTVSNCRNAVANFICQPGTTPTDVAVLTARLNTLAYKYQAAKSKFDKIEDNSPAFAKVREIINNLDREFGRLIKS